MFSTSDEYEGAALISERRAEGRDRKANAQASEATPFFKRLWPMIAFWGCAFAVACVVVLATTS